MYKVIKAFDDLQDFITVKGGRIYHHYSVGDEFPRTGTKASDERIAELASAYNAQGVPLIEEVYNGKAADPERMTKTELVIFAKENNISVDSKAKKEEILEQIMNAPLEEGADDDDAE
jgi:hypothetical protein